MSDSSQASEPPSADRLVGCIWGTALGDSLGLPYEGLSPIRARRILGPPIQHRFMLRRGMISDDTEHTCLVAQSLIASGAKVEQFATSLSWRLRLWLLTCPAGVGLATLRSIVRLWFGCSPDQSGVHSAGNGPAMRAAIIGAAIGDRERLSELIRISSRITHSDSRAELGAFAVALAASMARQEETVTAERYFSELRDRVGSGNHELLSVMSAVEESVARGQSTRSFAVSLGLSNGVSGYIGHSVPIAIHALLRYRPDFRTAIQEVIECGGDTDSNAAIVGGILGAELGTESLPADWLSSLKDWPYSKGWMRRLGQQLQQCLANPGIACPIHVSFVWQVLRNSLFLFVVLLHGFRRLLPPY